MLHALTAGHTWSPVNQHDVVLIALAQLHLWFGLLQDEREGRLVQLPQRLQQRRQQQLQAALTSKGWQAYLHSGWQTASVPYALSMYVSLPLQQERRACVSARRVGREKHRQE